MIRFGHAIRFSSSDSATGTIKPTICKPSKPIWNDPNQHWASWQCKARPHPHVNYNTKATDMHEFPPAEMCCLLVCAMP
eukprot:4412706-Amphidinium_carterae.2